MAGAALGMISSGALSLPFQALPTSPPPHTQSSSGIIIPSAGVPFVRGTGLDPLETVWLIPGFLGKGCPGLIHRVNVWPWDQRLLR